MLNLLSYAYIGFVCFLVFCAIAEAIRELGGKLIHRNKRKTEYN